ncbi:MAG: 4'-phosphopantetheinyl transferase family protein [Gammaproteobacteria bacterium]
MNSDFSLKSQTVDLWHVLLTDLVSQEDRFLALLSPDEVQRANRFRFPHHRARFILARGILREILSLYTGQSPKEIVFEYGPRGKPYLKDNHLDLQFNVSHSDDVAVYAITQHAEVGVDIQKIEEGHHESVAKRFFSEEENKQLQRLSEVERAQGFCQLWASKEALIKAVGEGLYVPLGDFSVALHKKSQWITLIHEQQTQTLYLENFVTFPEYKAAFATSQTIQEKKYWEWTALGPKLWVDNAR